jgi:hypothetical protein
MMGFKPFRLAQNTLRDIELMQKRRVIAIDGQVLFLGSLIPPADSPSHACRKLTQRNQRIRSNHSTVPAMKLTYSANAFPSARV